MQSIRGGATSTEDDDTTAEQPQVVVSTTTKSIPPGLVGVLDLRPDDVKAVAASSASIFATTTISDQTDDVGTTKAVIVSESDIGIFPASADVMNNDDDEDEGDSSSIGGQKDDNEAVAAETVRFTYLYRTIQLLVRQYYIVMLVSNLFH